MGKVQKEGGSTHFKKVPSCQKFQSLKNNGLFAISWGPLNRIIYTFLPYNTLILQIVIDIVSKFPIFNLFLCFWRGSFHIKMFPSFNISQVPFRGVIPLKKVFKLKKVIATWELFTKFRCFLILKAPLIKIYKLANHQGDLKSFESKIKK